MSSMSLWDQVSSSQASTTIKSENKPKPPEPVFAKNGIPLDPNFVIPPPQADALDIIWECIACDMQEMEFNVKQWALEFAPQHWKQIVCEYATEEENEDNEYLCPICSKLNLRWI
jgi:hypothetical protein